MSFLDKIAATLAPAASDEDRREARQKALQLSGSHPWIGTIVDQHERIEALIGDVIDGSSPDQRRQSLREFEKILNGHSLAEEVIVYPDIAEESSKLHATEAYEQHSLTKVQVAELEKLDPMSSQWREKAEHIRSALQQHMYQEESSWLPQLASKISSAETARVEDRFNEEYERYCGSGSISGGSSGRMGSAQPVM